MHWMCMEGSSKMSSHSCSGTINWHVGQIRNVVIKILSINMHLSAMHFKICTYMWCIIKYALIAMHFKICTYLRWIFKYALIRDSFVMHLAHFIEFSWISELMKKHWCFCLWIGTIAMMNKSPHNTLMYWWINHFKLFPYGYIGI